MLVNNDSHFRTILQNGPEAADEASRLLEQIKPTLPVLLANLTTIGQIGVTYHPSIEQLLVLLPTSVAIEQAAQGENHPDGKAMGDFAAHGRRSAYLHGRLHATQHMAIPGRPQRHRHTGRVVLQTPAGFADRRFAVPATIPAWVTRVSARLPSKSATATSHTCRWRCNSTPSVPIHWIRTCSPRASRPMTGLPPTAESSAPVEGTPLPPGAVPRGTPAGPRGENPPPGTIGAAVPPVPSSGPDAGAHVANVGRPSRP